MTLDDLIAQYPDRWQQAVANPRLRGWFVGQLMKAADTPDCLIKLARTEVEERALEQSKPDCA